ncbi:MAG: hypothetical protein JJU06_06760 [Ectothiorhodospiraceae bacterium]|nr:hypothetical protein [Ectothiorhodospiraceae bacterium]MCH8504498.1 hypothetical protein [Ectothiorhodospiraceae bacterium]
MLNRIKGVAQQTDNWFTMNSGAFDPSRRRAMEPLGARQHWSRHGLTAAPKRQASVPLGDNDHKV